MASYYHIFLERKPDVSLEDVQEKMDLALDWFRYGRNNWIVYTTSDANKWQARLKSLVEPDGSLFIVRLNVSDLQGWMVPDFWEWIQEKW